MKLTYEDKLEIYRLWKEEGWGNRRISKRFNIAYFSIRYIYHLIDRHGPEIVKHGKGKKIKIFTYKPNTTSTRKKQGHRQPYTEVKINKIG